MADLATTGAATASPSVTSPSATTSTGAQGTGAVSSDFETFLKMLTTQMQNQDPLNPMDSADFAVQLATFSNVEQQVRTNDLLEGLSSQMGIMGLAQLAGWVGMEVQSQAAVAFSGVPVALSFDARTGADTATLVVTDASGREVQRLDVAPGPGEIVWAGVSSGGDPVAPGSYTFTLESFANGELLGTSPVSSYQVVKEARADGGEVALVLEGGTAIPSQEVTAIRAPEPAI